MFIVCFCALTDKQKRQFHLLCLEFHLSVPKQKKPKVQWMESTASAISLCKLCYLWTFFAGKIRRVKFFHYSYLYSLLNGEKETFTASFFDKNDRRIECSFHKENVHDDNSMSHDKNRPDTFYATVRRGQTPFLEIRDAEGTMLFTYDSKRLNHCEVNSERHASERVLQIRERGVVRSTQCVLMFCKQNASKNNFPSGKQ